MKKAQEHRTLRAYIRLLTINKKRWIGSKGPLDNTNITRAQIEKDSDLDTIRKEERFTELLNRYRPV